MRRRHCGPLGDRRRRRARRRGGLTSTRALLGSPCFGFQPPPCGCRLVGHVRAELIVLRDMGELVCEQPPRSAAVERAVRVRQIDLAAHGDGVRVFTLCRPLRLRATMDAHIAERMSGCALDLGRHLGIGLGHRHRRRSRLRPGGHWFDRTRSAAGGGG